MEITGEEAECKSPGARMSLMYGGGAGVGRQWGGENGNPNPGSQRNSH